MNNFEINKVVKLINNGVFTDAEKLLQSILQKSDDRLAHYLKSIIFAKSTRFAEAETELLDMIEKDPRDIDALNVLAFVYRRQNKLKDALGIFNEAAELDQNRTEFYYHIAGIQILEGNLKAAFMAYAKVIEFDSCFAPAYNNLGIVYFESHEYNKAVNILRQGVNLAGKDPKLRYNYAIALSSVNMLSEAAHEYEVALELKPFWTSALNNLGVIQVRLGHLDHAGGSFDLILDEDPLNPEAWNNLGVVLAKQGFKEEALSHFHKALETRESYEDAKSNIQILEANKNDFIFSQFNMLLDEDTDIRINIPKVQSNPLQGEYLGVPIQHLVDLFKYLKDITAFLPQNNRKEFTQSDVRLNIEHIINTLEGHRGILQEIQETESREKEDISDNGESEKSNGKELKVSELTDFFEYLGQLTSNIPDASLAALLASKIKKAISAIK
ncbi:MAG: tetratricopeptide repeat protein [Treponema sp.]|jgi:tetratricopeptide (TPR) repeat protein|nr:tetratricopeptide repeat protein [Treponema sp.]